MLERLLGSDVAVVKELEPDLQHVRVDRGQLEQVLMNLAVNARDAMPDGGILTIATRNERVNAAMATSHTDLSAGDYVVIRVADSGQGMDAATLERAFEPFYTTKEAGKGTGLGLSTVYGIVRQHQGAVLVESRPGEGARFDVYLPAVAEPEENEGNAVSPGRPEGGSEVILLVEDEETIRGLAERVLQQYGYTVLVARNPSEAEVLAAEAQHVELLLTDVVMPGGSGLVLAATLRSRMPRLKVLVMSGFTGERGEEPPVPGDTPFLSKPFAPDDLARKVREALDA
jgi:CheY-like chemotaxis protein